VSRGFAPHRIRASCGSMRARAGLTRRECLTGVSSARAEPGRNASRLQLVDGVY
jgi:hypothetical protein